MRRHRLGKAFIHPTAMLQSSFHGAFTRLKALFSQVIDQQIRAPTRFEVTIIAWRLGQHGLQEAQSFVFLTIGTSGGWRGLETFKARFHISFQPTANGVFMATDGLGNGRNPFAPVREENREAAFAQAGGSHAACSFKSLALLVGQINSDHESALVLCHVVRASLHGIESLEFTDANSFLQFFPHGHLSVRPGHQCGL